jgi:hypothetical protein
MWVDAVPPSSLLPAYPFSVPREPMALLSLDCAALISSSYKLAVFIPLIACPSRDEADFCDKPSAAE